MIELDITHTWKSYHPSSKWAITHEETKYFDDMDQANKWINETYGKSKRSPMYIDTKKGESKKVGYVIGFRNGEYYEGKNHKFLNQDWITFRKSEVIEI